MTQEEINKGNQESLDAGRAFYEALNKCLYTNEELIAILHNELKASNEVLQACLFTAERRGAFTNWGELQKKIENRLEYQTKLIDNGKDTH